MFDTKSEKKLGMSPKALLLREFIIIYCAYFLLVRNTQNVIERYFRYFNSIFDSM